MIESICIYLTYMYGTAHSSIPAWASHMSVVQPHTHMSCPYAICQLCCHYFLLQCFFCLDPYFILTIFIGLFSFCQCIQLCTCHYSIESASSLSMGMITVIQLISGICSEYIAKRCDVQALDLTGILSICGKIQLIILCTPSHLMQYLCLTQ